MVIMSLLIQKEDCAFFVTLRVNEIQTAWSFKCFVHM